MTQINSDLIRGNLDMLVLSCLKKEDNYGYGIIKKIYVLSQHLYELKEPSLYSCLRRLETQDFIGCYWGDETLGARRKYYYLTDSGKNYLKTAISYWEGTKKVIDNVLEASVDEGND